MLKCVQICMTFSAVCMEHIDIALNSKETNKVLKTRHVQDRCQSRVAGTLYCTLDLTSCSEETQRWTGVKWCWEGVGGQQVFLQGATLKGSSVVGVLEVFWCLLQNVREHLRTHQVVIQSYHHPTPLADISSSDSTHTSQNIHLYYCPCSRFLILVPDKSFTTILWWGYYYANPIQFVTRRKLSYIYLNHIVSMLKTVFTTAVWNYLEKTAGKYLERTHIKLKSSGYISSHLAYIHTYWYSI